MNRIEFIEKLQRALAGGLNSSQVMEHVRYYREYIDTEMRKGRSEAEVLAELGDPRLLAKSIIEANKRAGVNEGTNRTYDEEMSGAGNAYRRSAYGKGAYDDAYGRNAYEENSYEAYGHKADGGRVFRVPGWLILLIVTVAVILVIGVAFSLISLLTPVIIPVLLVILVVWIVRGGQ